MSMSWGGWKSGSSSLVCTTSESLVWVDPFLSCSFNLRPRSAEPSGWCLSPRCLLPCCLPLLCLSTWSSLPSCLSLWYFSRWFLSAWCLSSCCLATWCLSECLPVLCLSVSFLSVWCLPPSLLSWCFSVDLASLWCFCLWLLSPPVWCLSSWEPWCLFFEVACLPLALWSFWVSGVLWRWRWSLSE